MLPADLGEDRWGPIARYGFEGMAIGRGAGRMHRPGDTTACYDSSLITLAEIGRVVTAAGAAALALP